ncbi:MAG: type II toxin-antitoxin system Phd/YefM family antitoxin [Terriglobales bacterium]
MSIKRVGVAELKADLRKHLRTVRRGGELVVCDHGHPFARIVPYSEAPRSLALRPPRRRLSDWKPTHNIHVKTDVVALLLEDRASR